MLYVHWNEKQNEDINVETDTHENYNRDAGMEYAFRLSE